MLSKKDNYMRMWILDIIPVYKYIAMAVPAHLRILNHSHVFNDKSFDKKVERERSFIIQNKFESLNINLSSSAVVVSFVYMYIQSVS